MQRREFITLLGSAAAGWPLVARAQQPRRTRQIGILSPGHALSDPIFQNVNAFLRALEALGYTEGQNLVVYRQYAEGSPARLSELAAELVGHNPEVIVAFSTTAARPVKEATDTIPIVVVAMA